MKPEDQNIAVAKKLGWTKLRHTIRGAGAPERGPSPYGIPPGKNYECSVTDFVTDANTWPQMWASLTDAEKEQLVKLLWREHSPAIFDTELCLKIFALTQPKRTELFLKVTNLWRD